MPIKHPEKKNPVFSHTLLILLMLLGFLLRVYQLDRPLGGGDENQYLLDYANTSFAYIVSTFFFGGHHVFHTLLMELMIMGFGDENAVAIRFPVFLCGMVTLWLIYKLAYQLFNSLLIARVSLLIAAVCPIHIYYSQTARGYSVMMALSVLMICSTLRILDSRQYGKAGWVFVFSGFLSIYTLLTNVYLVFGLAGWVLLVLLVPRFWREYSISEKALKKITGLFFGLFLSVAILSLLAYWPLLGQIVAEARSYHLPGMEDQTRLALVSKIFVGTVAKIFQGPLQWFLPFLVLGVFSGTVLRGSYRWLPVCVMFLPLMVTLVTGVGGYARNYLFNVPLLIIFMAAGLVRAGQFVENRMRDKGVVTGVGLAALYALVSLSTVASSGLLTTHPSGHTYKRMVEKHSESHDLIVIADSKNYLYAKGVYLENLKNIFLSNKLSGVKIIADDSSAIRNFEVNDGNQGFPVFRNLIPFQGLGGEVVNPGLKIFSLTGPGAALSLLPEDFESAVQWQTIRGAGRIKLESEHKLAGEHSLLLEADPKSLLIAETMIPTGFEVKHNTLAILLYGSYNRESNASGSDGVLVVPSLVARNLATGQTHQLRLGNVNMGIKSKMREVETAAETFAWKLLPYVGYFPPGRYALAMHMVAPQGQSILYDGLRLFLFETRGDRGAI